MALPYVPRSFLKPSAAQSIAGKRCGVCGRAPWRLSPVTLRVYLSLLWDSSPNLFGVDAGGLPRDKVAQRGKEDLSRSAERTEPHGCGEALFVSSLVAGGGFHARSRGRSTPGGGSGRTPCSALPLTMHPADSPHGGHGDESHQVLASGRAGTNPWQPQAGDNERGLSEQGQALEQGGRSHLPR